MKDDECYVRDGSGKVVTVAPQELCFRYIQQTCPDGEYTVSGPGVDLRLIRHDGVVYPVGGVIAKENFDEIAAETPDPESN